MSRVKHDIQRLKKIYQNLGARFFEGGAEENYKTDYIHFFNLEHLFQQMDGPNQSYRSHLISPHRGEFATIAKTVAIRGDFLLKCGKWQILLD